ncbi:MAG TPA: sigma-70 family RNA polymerase sigma factor [Bacteroides sp.]|nr:sigma-70 family RNA polymerase sigma factor [Bacteroides sp.]
MTQKEFRMLFEAHFEDIRRYLYFRSADAALSTDIAQETFLKVWEKQFELEPHKDAALLYKISGDILVSHIRRENLSRKIHRELVLQLVEPDLNQEVQYRELKERYQKALIKLNEKQRVVFMMSRMEHFTYREIAERLGISEKAVEKRMNGALKFLRRELEIT